MATRFRPSDRVRARTSGFVPQGTPGVVHLALPLLPEMYYVLFDGFEQPRLMHTRDLEAAANDPPRPSCPSAKDT